jgi:hypothetical protein
VAKTGPVLQIEEIKIIWKKTPAQFIMNQRVPTFWFSTENQTFNAYS